MMAQEMQRVDALPSNAIDDEQPDKLREWVVLSMQTDEMVPAVYPNDDLIVNTQEDFKNGDIVILIKKGGGVIVRRIYALENCVVFTSDNRRYEPIICGTDEELYNYEYFGKVSSIGRRVHQ